MGAEDSRKLLLAVAFCSLTQAVSCTVSGSCAQHVACFYVCQYVSFMQVFKRAATCIFSVVFLAFSVFLIANL